MCCAHQEAGQSNGNRKAEVYAEIMEKFKPVFHHFFMEQFPTPPQWFERQLAYTRSVAASSIGMQTMLEVESETNVNVCCLPFSWLYGWPW